MSKVQPATALNPVSIGKIIRQKRKEAQMTQDVTAALCGISKKTLIKIEKGGDVYLSTLMQVLDALGIRLYIEHGQADNHSKVTDDWF
jgi:transcriptional regulator with XRE-family HTH domain